MTLKKLVDYTQTLDNICGLKLETKYHESHDYPVSLGPIKIHLTTHKKMFAMSALVKK